MQLIGNLTDPNLLEIAGLLSLSYLFAYRPAKTVLTWLRNRLSWNASRVLKPAPNEYAVITGATDGIGLEYAKQLAAKGYRILLLSRTEEKLKRVAQEILDQYPQCQKVEILAVDFSKTDIYDRIKVKLATLDGPIHVLVNNVGTVNPIPDYFTNFGEGFNLRLINTNIVSLTLMSELVIKQILKHKPYQISKRPRGVIINISSGLGRSAFPLYSTYSASKGYVNYLTKILSVEYAKDNILVQNVSPNLVKTNLTKEMYDEAAGEKHAGVDAASFVRHALNTVGVEKETSAHPSHKFENLIASGFESVLCDRLQMKMKFAIMSHGLEKHKAKKAAAAAQGKKKE